jgi:hypothetical protein
MEVTTIIMIVMIILLFYIVVSYVMGGPKVITSLTSAKTMQTVATNSLDGASAKPSANFTYSIWVYLDDWNYQIGKSKPIFVRAKTAAPITTDADDVDISGDIYCPKIRFQPNTNAIDIIIDCLPATSSGSNQRDVCTVSNIPIQKWVNILVSVYGITEDVYLDGKLVKTHILPGPPATTLLTTAANAYITPNKGFSGFTNKFQYWGDATNPQQAWNTYQSGYGGNWVTNMFSQYSVKLAVMQGDTETTSISF